jgi:hypothetical protein
MWEINLMSKVSPVDLRNHRTRLKSYESRWNSNSRKEKKKKKHKQSTVAEAKNPKLPERQKLGGSCFIGQPGQNVQETPCPISSNKKLDMVGGASIIPATREVRIAAQAGTSQKGY